MSDDKKKKRKVTKSAHIYSGRSGEVTKTIERGDKKGTVVKKKKFHGTYSGHEKTVKKEGKLSKYKFKSSSEDGNKHIQKQSKGRSVEKITDERGNKIKSVERRSGKRVETIKHKDGSYKSRQVTGKGGNVKKTVTRTPGGVEKEIERGNKRIEVRKYKDEGVKTRTKINMKKNKKYKEDFVAQNDKNIKAALDFASNLKSSTFKNIPKQMFDNANSSQNTQIDGKISESKPLFTPFKYSAPSVQEKKSMYINDIKRNIKRDIINTTMDVIKKSSTEAAEEKKNK